jgi:tetratricopeptide (TPR) repeat protein
VAKHPHRYKDVKHPDKFAEALSNAWTKVEPYVIPAGITILVVIAIAFVWVTFGQRWANRHEAPWAKAFEVQRTATAAVANAQTDEARAQAEEKALADLGAVAHEYARRPVAAVALLDLAQGHYRLGDRDRTDKPDASRDHFQKAAAAAEQFLADFPDHGLAAVAAYEAGKARFELRDYARALEHFLKVQAPAFPSFVALAQWHAARCYEHLGQADAARRIYEALRNDPWAGWCGQQAQWRLTQLPPASSTGS